MSRTNSNRLPRTRSRRLADSGALPTRRRRTPAGRSISCCSCSLRASNREVVKDGCCEAIRCHPRDLTLRASRPDSDGCDRCGSSWLQHDRRRGGGSAAGGAQQCGDATTNMRRGRKPTHGRGDVDAVIAAEPRERAGNADGSAAAADAAALRVPRAPRAPRGGLVVVYLPSKVVLVRAVLILPIAYCQSKRATSCRRRRCPSASSSSDCATAAAAVATTIAPIAAASCSYCRRNWERILDRAVHGVDASSSSRCKSSRGQLLYANIFHPGARLRDHSPVRLARGDGIAHEVEQEDISAQTSSTRGAPR